MTPQAQQILLHLKNHGSITQAEAGTVYRIRALPRRIADLKEAGHPITRELKKDATGQRYARYSLVKELAIGSRIKIVNEGAESVSGRYYKNGDTGVITALQNSRLNITFRPDVLRSNLSTVYVSKGDWEVI